MKVYAIVERCDFDIVRELHSSYDKALQTIRGWRNVLQGKEIHPHDIYDHPVDLDCLHIVEMDVDGVGIDFAHPPKVYCAYGRYYDHDEVEYV